MAAELRYKLSIECTDTAGDYLSRAAHNAIESGFVVEGDADEVLEQQVEIGAGATASFVTMGSTRFFAVQAGAGAAGVTVHVLAQPTASGWTLPPNGWMMVHLLNTASTISIKNNNGDATTVRFFHAGT